LPGTVAGYQLLVAGGGCAVGATCYDAPVIHPATEEPGNQPSGPAGNRQPATGNQTTAPYSGPDPDRIRAMFSAIASRYDRANDVLSAGVHHLWRRRCVRASGVRPGDRVLDCATGTGDLAIAFRRVVGAKGSVTGTDFTPEMIELARAKGSDVVFEVADVTELPFDDASFDVASISFGIRNVGDPRRGLAEMARVVRPGGRVVVLEFGQPPSPLVAALYDRYRRHVLPRLGGAVTGERQAYEYLETSAARFPCGDDFVALMRESAPFDRVDAWPLTFGIAWLYRGVTHS
jgi:demethylmenaquinone methyltransferase/2-methoxy-6-polyprenyl-1,4-benzoquinol methylase